MPQQAPVVADPAARRRAPIASLTLVLILVLVDQATKLAALELLVLHRPVPVIPVFDLMRTYNTGAAFSLLSDAGGWQRWFFTGVAVVISIALVAWLYLLPRGQSDAPM